MEENDIFCLNVKPRSSPSQQQQALLIGGGASLLSDGDDDEDVNKETRQFGAGSLHTSVGQGSSSADVGSPSRKKDRKLRPTLDELAELLMSQLDCFQATQFKSLMASVEPCIMPHMLDCYLKGVNSVSLYRNKSIVETRLLHLFHKYDSDHDGLISFGDLPLAKQLLGEDPVFAERTELVVYDETAEEAHWNVLNSNKTNYEFEQSELSHLTYHPAIQIYTACCRNEVLVIQITDKFRVDVVAVFKEHTAPVLQVIHVPHVKKLFTTSADRAVFAWHESDKGWTLADKARVFCTQTCICYDPVTQWLVSGGTDGWMYIYKTVPNLQPPFRRVKAHKEWIRDIIVISDIEVVASCSSDGTVKFWERGSLALRSTKECKEKALSRMIYSRGARSLFTCANGREMVIWSPFLPDPTDSLPHEKPVVGAKCFPSSPELVTADNSGKVTVWDLRKTSVAQSLGAPDSNCPIGPVNSIAYNPHKNAIVTLGAKLCLFFPQKGSYTALMDMPVAALLYCNVSKRIVVALGNRILVFELTTGELLYSHNLGPLEVSCAVLCSAQLDLLLGTFEGMVVAVNVGTWNISKTLAVNDQVKWVFDLGHRSRLMHLSPEHARGLAVTAGGNFWSFAYGPLCDSVAHTTERKKVPLSTVDCVAFSPRLCLLCLTQKSTVVVWDIISLYQKSIQTLSTWVTSVICCDDLQATFFATSDGGLLGFHTASMVPICKVELGAGFKAMTMQFDRISWSLNLMSQDSVQVLGLDKLFTTIRDHQRNLTTGFKSTKLLFDDTYGVDTIVDSAAQPVTMRCRRTDEESGGMGHSTTFVDEESELYCMLLSEAGSDLTDCLDRLNFLMQFQHHNKDRDGNCIGSGLQGGEAYRGSTTDLLGNKKSSLKGGLDKSSGVGPGARKGSIKSAGSLKKSKSQAGFGGVNYGKKELLATLHDAWIPSVSDRCYSVSKPVIYCVFDFYTPTLSALATFEEVHKTRTGIDGIELKTDTKAVMEIKWLALNVAQALHAAHEAGFVTLFQFFDVRLIKDHYRLVLSQGLTAQSREEGAVDPRRLPITERPPEGVFADTRLDMWLLGCLLFKLCTGSTILPANATRYQIDLLFDDKDNGKSCVLGAEEWERRWSPFFKDQALEDCVKWLLQLNPAARWTTIDVIKAFYVETPPRHISCVPIPTVGEHRCNLVLDRRQTDPFIITQMNPVLPNASLSAMAICLVPTLCMTAEFNGVSAHLVLFNSTGMSVGMVPAHNQVRVLWTVDREEVQHVRHAVEDLGDFVGATGSGGALGGKKQRLQAEIKRQPNNPEQYCPFYTETKALKSREIEVATASEDKAYYMVGWHRAKHPITTQMSIKKRDDILRKEREVVQERDRWQRQNQLRSEKLISEKGRNPTTDGTEGEDDEKQVTPTKEQRELQNAEYNKEAYTRMKLHQKSIDISKNALTRAITGGDREDDSLLMGHLRPDTRNKLPKLKPMERKKREKARLRPVSVSSARPKTSMI